MLNFTQNKLRPKKNRRKIASRQLLKKRKQKTARSPGLDDRAVLLLYNFYFNFSELIPTICFPE